MTQAPSIATASATLPEAFHHLPSGTVRFWVLLADGQVVGASIRREILHYRYHATRTDDDPLVTYAANLAELHAAVRRRVARGSIEPVMLRDVDLQAPPQAESGDPSASTTGSSTLNTNSPR